MRVWVTGGFFDQSGECFVEEVDLAAGEHRPLLRFTPPPYARVPTKGFTGARWLDAETLLIASFCAVWRFDTRTWQPTGVLQQPDFNDLHDLHVEPQAGRLYVCNTGLDAVEVFDLDGRFLGRHSASPAWFDARRQDGWAVERNQFVEVTEVGWDRRAPPELRRAAGRYYEEAGEGTPFQRRVVRDYIHPNHVTSIEGHLAVTMLATRELRCLRTFTTLASFDGHPHDGVVFDSLMWTTSTDGKVCALDARSPGSWRVAESYDSAGTGHIGWCRGLLVSEEGIAVALTRMHARSQYRWRDDPTEGTETSVLWLERGSGKLLGRVDLGDARSSKLFGLLPPRCPKEVA